VNKISNISDSSTVSTVLPTVIKIAGNYETRQSRSVQHLPG